MARFLTDDWFEVLATAGAALPERPGLDLVIDHEVSGAPDGKVRFHVVVVDGRIAHVGPGKHGEAECTLAAKYADAVALLTGAMAHDVAYMQGRLKVDGDYARWLYGFAPVRAAAESSALLASVAGATELD